jgi:hypothetical protein
MPFFALVFAYEPGGSFMYPLLIIAAIIGLLLGIFKGDRR